MKKLMLIYNMHSGKGAIKTNLAVIIDEFNKEGWEVTAFSTQKRAHATELVRERGGEYSLIVCSGGDGTLSEVVDGLMTFSEEERPRIGYIPAGSTNDYASTLRLPAQLRKSAQLIAKQYFRRVDVGHFLNDYFIYVAAFGAFTEISYNTPQEDKNKLGHQAYLIQGIKQFPNFRPYRMKITIGEAAEEKDYIYGMVYNANSVGGFKNLSGRQIELDDGELDVMLIQAPENAVEWPMLLADILTKNPASKFISCYRAASICFEAQEDVDWVLDGEFGGAHRTVKIETCKQAVEIAVDPDET